MQSPPHQRQSVLSRFAAPYTFSPNLGFGAALVAVAGCLARIFGGCLLFAVWGGASAAAWSGIEGHFWRVCAVASLTLAFVAALAALLIGISALEVRMGLKR